MSSNTSEFFLKNYFLKKTSVFFCLSPSENEKKINPKVPIIFQVVEYLRIFLNLFLEKTSVFFGLSPSLNEKKLIQKFQ